MSIRQSAVMVSAVGVTGGDPGGGVSSIAGQFPGLWRRKADGHSITGTPLSAWDSHPDWVTSSFNVVDYLHTDSSDTAAAQFSLEFRGYFYPAITGIYKFRTLSDDGSLLWIGSNTFNPTNVNMNVDAGGNHGQEYHSSKFNLKLTQGQFYPFRLMYWNTYSGGVLNTEWSIYSIASGWSAWSNNFSGQIYYNNDTKGF